MKKQFIKVSMIAVVFAALLNTESANSQSWNITGNAGTSGSNFIGTTDNVSLKFRTKNFNRMTISASGNVGIGTSTPAYRLDVFGNSTYVGVFTNTSTGVNNYGLAAGCNNTPGYGTGVIGSGGYIGVRGESRLAGIGDRYGVYAYAEYGTNVYGIYAHAAGGGTSTYAGYFVGNVNSTGFYSGSDRKLKNDIKPLTGALSIIEKLKPSVYTFKTTEYKQMQLPEGLQYGLIADEVQQVIPGAVKKAVQPAMYENEDGQDRKKISDEVEFNAVNYIEMIPILISGMKEQQVMIEKLTAQVAVLEGNNMDNGTAKIAISTNATENKLFQNQPNPFNQTTIIHYALSAQQNSGMIRIRDLNGNIVKTIAINNSGKGQVTVNANELSQGTYTYTLEIAGESLDTKLMVITK